MLRSARKKSTTPAPLEPAGSSFSIIFNAPQSSQPTTPSSFLQPLEPSNYNTNGSSNPTTTTTNNNNLASSNEKSNNNGAPSPFPFRKKSFKSEQQQQQPGSQQRNSYTSRPTSPAISVRHQAAIMQAETYSESAGIDLDRETSVTGSTMHHLSNNDAITAATLDDIQSGISLDNDHSLRDSQHTLDMICQAAMDAVIIISESGSIKSVNEEALRLFGYNLWEIAGKNVKMLMPRQHSTHHDHYLDRYRKTKVKRIIGQQRTDIKGVRKDGSTYPIILKVSEIADRNGVVFLAVIKNVGVEEEFVKIKSMVVHMLPGGYHERLFDDAPGMGGQLSNKIIADEFKGASILAIGVDGFLSHIKSCKQPSDLVYFLNEMLTLFDDICDKQQLTQIKTVGDTYIAGAGVTSSIFDASVRVMEAAIELLDKVNTIKKQIASNNQYQHLQGTLAADFNIKIGVSSGNVFSGVTKSHRFGFDVWGEPVQMAQFLKDDAIKPNCIKVCQSTYQITKHRYEFQREDAWIHRSNPLYHQLKTQTSGDQSASTTTSSSRSSSTATTPKSPHTSAGSVPNASSPVSAGSSSTSPSSFTSSKAPSPIVNESTEQLRDGTTLLSVPSYVFVKYRD